MILLLVFIELFTIIHRRRCAGSAFGNACCCRGA